MTSPRQIHRQACVRIELPFPPSTNNLFANVGRRRIKTAAYSAWLDMASIGIKDSQRANMGPYCLLICLRRPDKRRRDLGNLEKAVSDLLVANGVIQDDSLSQRITLQWDDDLPADCVVIVQEAQEALAT